MGNQEIINSTVYHSVINSFRRSSSRFLLLCILISIGGCKKKSVEPDIVKIKWERDQRIVNSLGLMNSSFSNNQLNVLAPTMFFKNLSRSTSGPDPNSFRLSPYTGAGRLKFPVPEQYYAFTDVNKVIIRSASTVESESVEKIIDLKSLDPDFFALIDIPYWQSECMVINNNNFLLLPYKAVKNNYSVPTPYFMLTEIGVPGNRNNQIEIKSVKLIQKDILPGESNVFKLQTFYNYFFAVIGSYTYRIDTEGNLEQVSEKPLNIFRRNEELFAFAPNNNTGKAEFLKSPDQGKTWTLLGEIGINVNLLVNLQYTLIGNKVIGYQRGQLFQFESSGINYSLTEMENEGLGLAEITSVSMADEKTVFITSRCNTFTDICGGYYKPVDNFFVKKKAE